MMERTDAGGQHTQTPAAAEISLQAGLQDVAGAVAALLAEARAIDAARDEYGHARSRAYTDAVALLKASAKVGRAIAELRGTKFEHNINVRREAAVLPPPLPQNEDDASEPDWDYRKYQGCNYDPSIRFKDGTVFVHGKGRVNVPENWDEERWLAGLPQKEWAGDPLRISGGSNGNFAAAEHAGPRVRSL